PPPSSSTPPNPSSPPHSASAPSPRASIAALPPTIAPLHQEHEPSPRSPFSSLQSASLLPQGNLVRPQSSTLKESNERNQAAQNERIWERDDGGGETNGWEGERAGREEGESIEMTREEGEERKAGEVRNRTRRLILMRRSRWATNL